MIKHEQLLGVVRPRPEAPPRPRGAGDLGPAKAESPVLSRVAAARLYSCTFGVPRNTCLAERCLKHAQGPPKQGRDRSSAPLEKPLHSNAHAVKADPKRMPHVWVKAVRL